MRRCNRGDQCETEAMARCRATSFITGEPLEQFSDVALNAGTVVSNHKVNVVRTNALQRDRDDRTRRRMSQCVVEKVGKELL